jgi:AraC-like DNA-binding protein
VQVDEAAQVNEYERARPSPALRPYVAFYSGYRQRDVAPGIHRGLPSPYLTLIFTLDEPLVVVAHPDPRQAPGSFDALLGGLHLTPALIRHDGRQSGIQVAVRPLGCRALLGLPAGELAATDVDAADVLGGLVAELRDRIRAAPDWPARFAVVDALLGRRLAAAPTAVPGTVEQVWRSLLASGGAVPVSALAADVGWSARHLTKQFQAELGLAPKAAARVVRFDRARRRLAQVADGTTRLAELAVDAGYYDQAHLAREFRSMAGCSASRWLADEFAFVQAGDPGPDEDGGHD